MSDSERDEQEASQGEEPAETVTDDPMATIPDEPPETMEAPGDSLSEESSDAWSLVEEEGDFTTAAEESEELEEPEGEGGEESAGASADEESGGGGLGLPSPSELGGSEDSEGEEIAFDDGVESEELGEAAQAVESGEADTEDAGGEETGGGAELEEIEETGPPSPGGSKPPELPEQPDDVKGSRETPDEKLSLQSGQTVGGRFTVERYLGSSGGGISYQCREEESGRAVVIKVLSLGGSSEQQLERIRTQIRTASQIRHRNLTDILGMGRTEDGEIFVAMDFVEGETISRAVARQREKGREIGLSEVFHVLAHICEGLKAVHEQMVHGVLTPFNIYLTETGMVQIQNLGFGQVAARLLHERGSGPFVESIYVPPEVARDSSKLSATADMYSLGMITAELLSGGGLPRDRSEARDVALRIARQFGEGVSQLVATSLEPSPGKRVASPGEFRMGLHNAVRDAGVDPAEGLPEESIRIEPAIEVDTGDDDDLFDIPGPDQESPEPETGGDDEERYLVRKDGLDYGPVSKEEVLEQLYDDEIDEHTSVLDRETQSRSELGELERFRQEVEEYIPKREERKRKERERREEIERKVKQGGKAVLVVGIIAGLVVLGAMSYYYFTRPDPKQLPVGKAFVSLDYKFLPPPKDFKTVSANEDVLEKIFNPQAGKEEIARQVEQARSQGGGGGGGGGTTGGGGGGSGSKGSGEEEVATVDMSEGSGSKHLLTDKEINNIILSDFSALRRCIQKELSSNPSFSGVTVKFYIRPSGTTGGVKLRESQYTNKPVGRCLVREFRQMKFPAHNAVSNKGVTFPLKVRR